MFHTSGSVTIFPSPVWVNVSEDLPFLLSIKGIGIPGEGGKKGSSVSITEVLKEGLEE